MLLPLPLLWRLKMPVRQKLAVTAVFSLASVTIAMDILRLVETEKALPEVTWLYTSLETEVAVIIASLPAFSFLVTDSEGDRERRRRLRRGLSLHPKISQTRLRLSSSAGETNQANRLVLRKARLRVIIPRRFRSRLWRHRRSTMLCEIQGWEFGGQVSLRNWLCS